MAAYDTSRTPRDVRLDAKRANADIDQIAVANWPAPGSVDTELGVFDGAGGASWRGVSLRGSSSLRRCAVASNVLDRSFAPTTPKSKAGVCGWGTCSCQRPPSFH